MPTAVYTQLVNDFLSLSRTSRSKEIATNIPSHYAGATGNRLTSRDATKERAQRLYAIGELNAAAQLLCELAARRHPHRTQGEAIDG